MAVATIARQGIGIASLSSSRSPLTFFRSWAGICVLSSSLSSGLNGGGGGATTTSRRNVDPRLFVLSPVQTRAQLVTSPRDIQVRGNGGKSSDSRGCFDDAVALLASAPVLPKLVVLDLDFTVWPFYCWFFQSLELLPGLSFSADSAPSIEDIFAVDCSLPTPSEAVDDINNLLLSAQHWSSGQVSDNGAPPTAYPQVVDIVKALAAYKVEMAIASRTPSSAVAKIFLEQLSIGHHFNTKEIYFTLYSKTKHFTALKEKTGISFENMLFFDDEIKNIASAAKLGVTGILVTEGVDLKSLEKGLALLGLRN